MLGKVPEMLDVSLCDIILHHDDIISQAIQRRMLQELVLIVEKASIRVTQMYALNCN